MPTILKPTPIAGFLELLPADQILFAKVLDIIRMGFERYGFSPIETPAVERKEVLASKSGIEKEIYALSRFAAETGEDSQTDLALHFDLTVPLARYVAMHKDKLVFPFRRYQIQKVWRAERAQPGHYSEFYQCDIDVIGQGSLSLLADAEIPSVIYRIFCEMQIGPFVIKLNNRKILNGYFEYLGIPEVKAIQVMGLVDKLETIGTYQLIRELTAKTGIEEATAQKLVGFLSEKLTNHEMLIKLEKVGNLNRQMAEGSKELRIVVDGMRTLDIPEEYFSVDFGVARGLDYYTGTVYETVLTDYLGIGSICSGGRYDNLASHFAEENFPGVGMSIGATRLVPRLIEVGLLKRGPATTAAVLITSLAENRTSDYLRMGATLRENGIATEVYFEKATLSEQLRYAIKKGFCIVIISSESEFEQNLVKIRNLNTGDQSLLAAPDLVSGVKKSLITSI